MLRFYLCILINLYRVPLILTRLVKMKKNKEKYPIEIRYRELRRIVRMIKTTCLIRTRAYGLENLPKEGGYVMFPNHQGKYDALGIVHTHKEPCSIVMDEAKSHTPVTSQVIDISGGKRMKINDVRQALTVINEMAEEAAAGKKFIIFPEGGYRHNHNKVKAFKPGSFKCAVKAKVPIVPIALFDSYKAFEGLQIGIINTQVHYLKPIMPEEYENLKTVEIAEIVRKRIIEKITELEVAKGRKISNEITV